MLPIVGRHCERTVAAAAAAAAAIYNNSINACIAVRMLLAAFGAVSLCAPV